MDALRDFESKLLGRFDIRIMGPLHWFLGIRIVRDDNTNTLWLCLDSYIDKIVKKFDIQATKDPVAPLADHKLTPSKQKPDPKRTKEYQRKVGSLGYAATMGRPDIAHEHSLLARFLTNPSDTHLQYANRVLRYLLFTKNFALQYGPCDPTSPESSTTSELSIATNPEAEEPVFYGASDAAYADDPDTRKSSQGYLFKLFGGTVDWKANLQRCVTRSTTEAELIAVSAAAGELQWWTRLFNYIGFNPGNKPLLWCDNMQTVRLLNLQGPKLDTKLRHVDVHQNWLRQEALAKRIKVTWKETSKMPADGLTKVLPKQKRDGFVKQLGLVDISEVLASSAKE